MKDEIGAGSTIAICARSEADFSACVERVLIYREALTDQGVRCAMAQIDSPTETPTETPT